MKTALMETNQQTNYSSYIANTATGDADKTKGQFQFTTLTVAHAEQVARLHIEGIPAGFVSSLGLEFVTTLYEAIIRTKTSFGFVTGQGFFVIVSKHRIIIEAGVVSTVP